MPPRARVRLPAVIAAALLALAAACGGAPPRPDGPNVLWICIDVLRADRLGAYGYEKPTSPHLDRLAREGALFRHAFAQSSWTKPSVPSAFTSTYPAEHQVLEGSTHDTEGRVVSDVLDARFATAAELFRDAGYATGAFVTNAQLRSFLGFDQGFDVYAEEVGSAEEINEAFTAWMGSADRPFFAYLHYLDVHWPYRPDPAHRALFPAPETDLDVSGPGAPSLLDRINAGRVAVSDDDRAALVALYDAAVHQVDAAVGALQAELAHRGELARTLVVVTSDHGEELFEHGVIGHGRSLRDTLLRIPLVVAGPGVSAGRVVEEPVESVDVLPTLLALAGLPVPERLRGRSLRPLLAPDVAAAGAGRADAPPPPDAGRPVFAQLLRSGSYHRSVRVGDWKLVESYLRRDAARGGGEGPRGRLAVAPGQRVKVRGAVRGDGRFLARHFEVEEEDGDAAVVRGPISALSLEEGWLEVGPFRAELPPGVSFRHRERWLPLDPEELAVGSLVEVDGAPAGPRRLRARKVELRVDENEALQLKVEGPVEAVSPELPPSLRLLGLEVVFEAGVPLPGVETADESRPPRRLGEDALHDPALWERRVALHHVASDPSEHDDVAAARPEVTERLAALLSQWSRDVAGDGVPATRQRDLDPETVDRLRALGYVE